MKYKNLSRVNERISVIGQGCMGIGGDFHRDTTTDKKNIDNIQLGIDLGMTFIDTAEVYGEGHSEELIGKAIRGKRDKVFISTKFSEKNNSFKDIEKSVDGSLRRLGTEYIDLYQVHWPNPNFSIEETMKCMERLVNNGKIKYIGGGNFSLKNVQQAENSLIDIKLVSLQMEYNFFDRSAEAEILPYCKDNGIMAIAYSPLYKGRLRYEDEKILKLKKIADKYGKTISQVALNWLITNSPAIVIPKTTNAVHIHENALAADFILTKEDYNLIGELYSNNCNFLDVKRIRVLPGKNQGSFVYETLEQAKENKLGFVPSPIDLSKEILNSGEKIKPVKVIPTTDTSDRYDFDLIEGRIRYWAWVMAYNGDVKIPVYILSF